MLDRLNVEMISHIVHYGKLFKAGKFIEAFHERKKTTEEKDNVIILSMKQTYVESKHRQYIGEHHKNKKSFHFPHCSCGWTGEDMSLEDAKNTCCPNKLSLMKTLKL